ncbi:geranylgeranylglyceryl/heptaprenylglyceryl phosphate synthase [Candidatus Marinimicrobia bacterium]|nr:geranylgeranylglyceryl/heptaprenylglyceryl phosphate synthase [Candidatus Neomarinimicrobiota bacterium]
MKICNNTYEIISGIKEKLGHCKLALIDPDTKNDDKLNTILDRIHSSNFHGLLIGGSSIADNKFEDRIQYIKENTNLPLILFPGSYQQITKQIDTMLYLNLISGRNPKYLIEEQVYGSIDVYNYHINPIPTAYILLDGGNQTSVSRVSQTAPLCMKNKRNVLSHALAGQHLGNKLIYFDNGSGANFKIEAELLKYINKHITIPIIVGGGIKCDADIKELIDSGASYIVVGTYFENNH